MRNIFITSLFVLLLTSCQVNQDKREKSLADIRTALTEFMSKKSEDFSGSILVAKHDSILFERQFGVADRAKGKLIDTETLFELASVSKQFTAMGIMILKERAMLSYSDSLQKFFPDLKAYPKITIRHLLTHTSGLPAYENFIEQYWDKTRIARNSDVIALMAHHEPPSLFAPGEKWEYSNTGYMILASVIEKVSGKTYGAFLKDEIFTPLRMHKTRVYNTRRSGEILENYAFGYVKSKDGRYILPDSLPEMKFVIYLDGTVGDGTVNSTARELLKWKPESC